MRQLKKPPAQAIEHLNSDDEIDDMPFLGGKSSKAGKKSSNMMNANVQVSAASNKQTHQNSRAQDALAFAAEYYPDRKPITGASKLSEQSKMHQSQQSQ